MFNKQHTWGLGAGHIKLKSLYGGNFILRGDNPLYNDPPFLFLLFLLLFAPADDMYCSKSFLFLCYVYILNIILLQLLVYLLHFLIIIFFLSLLTPDEDSLLKALGFNWALCVVVQVSTFL